MPEYSSRYLDSVEGVREVMTMRDQLAMKAMSACLSNPGLLPDREEELIHLAKMSYFMADAMLEARKK